MNSPKGGNSASGQRRRDNDRPRDRLRRYGPAVLLGALALLSVQGLFGPHGALAMYRTKKQVRQLEQEIDKMKQENRRLADQVKSLKSDPAAIERIAREQMGLARPGELVFKLPEKTNQATSPIPGSAFPAGASPPASSAKPEADKTPQR